MRRAALIAACVLAFYLQITFLPALRPFGVVPNVVLPLVALIGLETTVSFALGIAVVMGVLLDMSSGANFGAWTAVLVIAVLAAGLLRRAGIELSSAVIAPVMVAAGTVVMALTLLVPMIGQVDSWPVGVLIGRLGTQLVLNLILTVGLGPVVRSLVPHQPRELTIG